MDTTLSLKKFEEIRDEIISFFRRKNLIPIVGAGVSHGLETYKGHIPNGKQYYKHMLDELKRKIFSEEDRDHLEKSNFSNLCDYYEDDENVDSAIRFSYLKNNFYKAFFKNDDKRKLLFKIDWPYIYSLNIDDAIESSTDYNFVILPNKDFREDVFIDNKCLIKLHGDIKDIVTYNKHSKIFTSREYVISLEENLSLLNKLKNDYANQNIIYIGCSLDDEIDLKFVSNLPMDFSRKDNLRKTIIFVKGTPSKLQISKYKTYGITDIICFDDYDSMYTSIYGAWVESQAINVDDIISCQRITINNISPLKKDENNMYFFWSKGLFDAKNSNINYPYYFIDREISMEIIKNLPDKVINIIRGSRFSGKSYLLAGIFRKVQDRKIYYFDGKARVSNSALQALLLYENSLIIIDSYALLPEQILTIIKSAKDIKSKNSNYIIAINESDSETKGIIAHKFNTKELNMSYFTFYNLKNKLTHEKYNSEVDIINKLFPVIDIPPYIKGNTFIDHMVMSETILNKKGKFSQKAISISSYKELVLLLMLATKEKIYSSEIISFALDVEIVDALRRYNPMIERIETMNFEKDSSDYSSIKYVLNSKYWLRKELGTYARDKNNFELIAKAYSYIVDKCIDCNKSDIIKQRKKYKNYIMFDIINEVFLNQYGGNIHLIAYIYDKLHDKLATDFNFLHQHAKGLVHYSFFSNNDLNVRMQLLEKARIYSAIAESMVEQCNLSEPLLISLNHIRFTKASIQAHIVKLNDYSNFEDILLAINLTNIALSSPHNLTIKSDDKIATSIYDLILYLRKNYENIIKKGCDRNKLNWLFTYNIHR